jgi:hypothetical protein
VRSEHIAEFIGRISAVSSGVTVVLTKSRTSPAWRNQAQRSRFQAFRLSGFQLLEYAELQIYSRTVLKVKRAQNQYASRRATNQGRYAAVTKPSRDSSQW